MAKLYSVFCYNGLETWAVRVRGERLETREGGPSVVPTYRAIPRAQCLRRDPLAEMGRRIGGRIRAGFTRLGRGDFPCDRLRLVHPGDAERLDLQWAPRAWVPREGFDGLGAHLAAVLNELGWRATWAAPADSALPELTLSVGQVRWGIAREPDGRLEDAFRPTSRTVPQALGTAPVLVLLYLLQRFPGSLALRLDPQQAFDCSPLELRMTQHDYWLGDEVAPYGDTLRLAAALGMRLQPAPKPRPVVIDGASPAPLWF